MGERTCSIEGCEKRTHARRWCVMHYTRWLKWGDPHHIPWVRVDAPPTVRFWEKVDKDTDDCWRWTATLNPGGYGQFWNGAKLVSAHRWAYEHLVGPIPDGLQLDHLCRVRNCVRPDHLEPVTHRENGLRGISPNAVNAAKTHCKHGHEFTPENTIVRTGKGRSGRECRECKRQKDRAYRRAKETTA